MIPSVTIAVPVCGTAEPLLRSCLNSLCSQDFPNLEILVIDDNGTPSAQRACRSFIKSLPHAKNITYRCNEKNIGILESRRRCFEDASGTYVCMVDGDDLLAAPDAVSRLYRAAVTAPPGAAPGFSGFDVVQCGCSLHDENALFDKQEQDRFKMTAAPCVQTIVYGTEDLPSAWFRKDGISCYVWAKLYKKEAALEAFNRIPNMYCCMTEDVLISYFFAREMKSYTCIPDQLYTYNLHAGITAASRVTDLERWNKLCSASSVFTSIAYDLEERPFAEGSPVPGYIRGMYLDHITRTAYLLVHGVDEAIKDEARALFIEAWGAEPALKAIASVQNNTTSSVLTPGFS